MMNRNNPNQRTSRLPQNPRALVGEVADVETGPQSYLELLRSEMAREKMSRRASRQEKEFFELTLMLDTQA